MVCLGFVCGVGFAGGFEFVVVYIGVCLGCVCRICFVTGLVGSILCSSLDLEGCMLVDLIWGCGFGFIGFGFEVVAYVWCFGVDVLIVRWCKCGLLLTCMAGCYMLIFEFGLYFCFWFEVYIRSLDLCLRVYVGLCLVFLGFLLGVLWVVGLRGICDFVYCI